MQQPEISRVVFDCYGTLVDIKARRNHRKAAAAICEQLAVEERVAKQLVYPLFLQAIDDSHIQQDRTEEYVAKRITELSLEASPAQVLDILGGVLGADRGKGSAKVGVLESLDTLRSAGKEAAVLSNCIISADQMGDLLADAGVIVEAELMFLSSAGVPKKPHPDAYRLAGGPHPPERLLMIGDDDAKDLATARELGWATALVGPDDDMREVLLSWL